MDKQEDLNWPLLLGLYLAMAAFLVFSELRDGSGVLFADTDDAMRMVSVRDLLWGQNWFDHASYRSNTPFGASMHWSRLVDLPIAVLVLLFRPLAGAQAEIWAGYAWPLLLLFIFLVLIGKLTLRLVGRHGLLPALVLPALSLSVTGEFSPGRVDHHSIQMILTLVIVWASIEALERPLMAIWAGLAAATALAIAIEILPILASAIVIFGFFYAFSPARGRAVRSFGLALGLGTLAHLALALPPSQWLVEACDALSIVYVAIAMGAGLGLVVLTWLPLAQAGWPIRLVVGAAVGGGLALALAMAFPACLAGPYAAVDPWLAENWLSNITEAQSAPIWLGRDPGQTIALFLPIFAGLAIAIAAVAHEKGDRRTGWLMLGFYLFAALAVALLQTRGIRLAVGMVFPAAAYAITGLRARYLTNHKWWMGLALLASWLAFANLPLAAMARAFAPMFAERTQAVMAAAADRLSCRAPSAYADLAALPPERIMAPGEMGAHIMLYTPHSIVAAAYHRDNEGLLDTFGFFNGPIDEARAILEARGIGLVVTCAEVPEMRGTPEAAPDSFVRLFASNDLPDWLEDVSLPGARLKVYAVMPR